MKTLFLFLMVMLFSQIAICQNKSIKVEQLFITNNLTGKSVKLLASEETLTGFGKLIKVQSLDSSLHSEDYAKQYVFDGIDFFISSQGKIASFETASNDIILEKKGSFAVSPGNKLADLTSVFPEQVNQAMEIQYGASKEKFLCVKLQLSDFNKNINQYSDIDYSLNLLYDPQTKILERIYIWIRP